MSMMGDRSLSIVGHRGCLHLAPKERIRLGRMCNWRDEECRLTSEPIDGDLNLEDLIRLCLQH